MSLFICPKHGLHHGPFCCAEPQEWWDGTFADDAKAIEAQRAETTKIGSVVDESAVPKRICPERGA